MLRMRFHAYTLLDRLRNLQNSRPEKGAAMTQPMKIDFVSDVSCPWCVIGLKALEQALERIGDVAEIHFQPFELNPNMPPEGQDIGEHPTQKYGSTPAQQNQMRDIMRERGAAVGFEFRHEGRDRIYNTFDAHRLLHWAELEGGGRQRALKQALFDAYFTHGKSPADHAVLVELAAQAGLDAERAKAILASNEFADEVRAQAQFYLQNGIRSVPAIIINERHLISGGQPVEVFEQALKQIAAEEAQAV
jgi:predicted DsbA family dithiol-disulfide isomerase